MDSQTGFSYSVDIKNKKHSQLNHGAIGNGRVLALVSPTSAIEWLCLYASS